MRLLLIAFLFGLPFYLFAQQPTIPAAYANLRYDSAGTLLGKGTDGNEFVLRRKKATTVTVTPQWWYSIPTTGMPLC